MIYLQLFLSFLQIGAFSFGGGYAAMPLIQNQVVQLHPWLSQSEFTDLITISQMTPGPIAINSATFVGTRIAGMPGALAATAGCVLPSCILVTLLAKIYLKYRNLSLLQGVLKSLRPAVIAMIAAAGASILVNAFWGESIASLTASQLLPNISTGTYEHTECQQDTETAGGAATPDAIPAGKRESGTAARNHQKPYTAYRPPETASSRTALYQLRI